MFLFHGSDSDVTDIYSISDKVVSRFDGGECEDGIGMCLVCSPPFYWFDPFCLKEFIGLEAICFFDLSEVRFFLGVKSDWHSWYNQVEFSFADV